jgi:DNA-binding winged helix-turn-helix (wHTH) protein
MIGKRGPRCCQLVNSCPTGAISGYVPGLPDRNVSGLRRSLFLIQSVTAYSPERRPAIYSFRRAVDEPSLRSYKGEAPATAASAGPSVPPAASAGGPTQPGQQTLLLGNLEIRPDEIQALADGRRVGLTVREFQVLLALARHDDRVVRRADIYGQVWGGEMKHRDRSVDVFVRKVRDKLARAAPDWAYIHTHFGVGYRFAAIPPSEAQPPALAGATGAPEPAQA